VNDQLSDPAAVKSPGHALHRRLGGHQSCTRGGEEKYPVIQTFVWIGNDLLYPAAKVLYYFRDRSISAHM